MADVPYIRPLIEVADEPGFMVLRYLDDNVYTAASIQRLSRKDLRLVARTILGALEALHPKGYNHSGKLRRAFTIWSQYLDYWEGKLPCCNEVIRARATYDARRNHPPWPNSRGVSGGGECNIIHYIM